MMDREKYTVAGLMSGTSLDGLDIAICTFSKEDGLWEYKILHAVTVRYSSKWLKALSNAHALSGEELTALDYSFGRYLGETTREVLGKNKLKVDFISSHGHTVFHQPQKGFTLQIGNGNALSGASAHPVVYDFRALDVVLGGEGAPLVPAGDKFLFGSYDVCLNLGGIANLSTDVKGKRIAFDICFVNIALNYLASKAGKKFDKNGSIAQAGDVNTMLLKKIRSIYSRWNTKRPSLAREHFEKQIRSLLDNERISLEDRLRTMTESAAEEIIRAIQQLKKTGTVLCTGGGAFNSFLVSRMLDLAGDELTLVIPEEEVVKFKEAIVFGFLGVLRLRNEVNCLKSVTRAVRDSSSGILVGF